MSFLDKINELSENEGLTAISKENTKLEYYSAYQSYNDAIKDLKDKLILKFKNDLQLYSQSDPRMKLTEEKGKFTLNFAKGGIKVILGQSSRSGDLFEKYSVEIFRGDKKASFELLLKPHYSRVHRPKFDNRDTLLKHTPIEKVTQEHIATLNSDIDKFKAEKEIFDSVTRLYYEITKDGMEKFSEYTNDEPVIIYNELLKLSGLFKELDGT